MGRISFRSSDDALVSLKAAVSSGRPVQVHLDVSYLPTWCRALNEHPADCDRMVAGFSHALIVTGYDPSSIYLNDAPWPDGWGHPTSRDDPRFKDIKVPVAEFMVAWDQAKYIGPWGTEKYGPYGPYWMVFIEQTSGAQLRKKSVEEILAIQKDLSRNVVADIDQNAGGDLSGTSWDGIAKTRALFGDYLAAHGHGEAAAVYHSLAGDWDRGESMTTEEARAMIRGVIRAKEIEARSKF
ncbi:MAG TPA: hypothetical protein VFL36_20175 [Myxococcales bacterium]|nr:hypothetical protein [Myxococcales bacterium]